jgi:hypothetical protein
MLEWILLFCIASSDGNKTCSRIVFPTRRECIAAVDNMKSHRLTITSSMCFIGTKEEVMCRCY